MRNKSSVVMSPINPAAHYSALALLRMLICDHWNYLETRTSTYGQRQTLLTCAKVQETRLILPDGFSIGYIRLGMRLRVQVRTGYSKFTRFETVYAILLNIEQSNRTLRCS